MTPTPKDPALENKSWYRPFVADRSRTLRATLTFAFGLAMAWSLRAADFGTLQSAFALAALLAAVTNLGLDSLIRERLKKVPDETRETIGTAMGLRCLAGAVAYLAVVMVTSPHQTTPRSIWLVATLLVLTQSPLLLGLRLEGTEHHYRVSLAHNVGLIFSCLTLGVLIWNNAYPVWFAAAIVLEHPVTALMLVYAHEKAAPEEDAFGWEWSAVKDWTKRCWPLIGPLLLPLLIVPISQVLVMWTTNASQAGTYALAAILMEFGAFVAFTLITARAETLSAASGISAQTQSDLLGRFFNHSALIGWLATVGTGAIAVVLGLTLFRQTFPDFIWVGPLLALSQLPIALGAARDTQWKRAGLERRSANARYIAAAVNVVTTGLLAHFWGAIGAAGGTLLSQVVGEFLLTGILDRAHGLGGLQAKALFFRNARPIPAPAPKPSGPLAPAVAADEGLDQGLQTRATRPPISFPGSMQAPSPSALPNKPATS